MSEKNKSSFDRILSLKKEVMIMRVKKSMGETIILKDYREKKKEIARLLTKSKI